jgi:hypothetical protein
MKTTIAPVPTFVPVMPDMPDEGLPKGPQKAAAKRPPDAQPQINAVNAPVITSVADFESMADNRLRGAHHVKAHNVPHTNRPPPRRARRSSESSLTVASADGADPDTPAPSLDHAVDRLLNVLESVGDARVRSDLEERYDPLERYALFNQALQRLGSRGLPPEHENRIRGQLQQWKQDLRHTYGSEIDRGMATTRDMESALQHMERAGNRLILHGGSPDEVRAFYGAKGNGRQMATYDPVNMAKKLLRAHGDENFQQALNELRSGTLRGLSSMDVTATGPRTTGPRLWLSLEDASAFRTVQSAHKSAHELGVRMAAIPALPAMKGGELTVHLLETAAGKGSPASMVEQIANFKELPPDRRGRTYREVYRTFDNLPNAMWPEENSPKPEVLKHLNGKMTSSFAEAPSATTKVQKKESALRALHAELSRAPKPGEISINKLKTFLQRKLGPKL